MLVMWLTKWYFVKWYFVRLTGWVVVQVLCGNHWEEGSRGFQYIFTNKRGFAARKQMLGEEGRGSHLRAYDWLQSFSVLICLSAHRKKWRLAARSGRWIQLMTSVDDGAEKHSSRARSRQSGKNCHYILGRMFLYYCRRLVRPRKPDECSKDSRNICLFI